ncbi:hypothetical protein ACIRL2_16990 [Embleya sp. NPDC127516]|uniref:hypothetical protein n=1 Tax=Embleya sp. NPDC127516 TaxID=3363990 RepID=UPI0038176BC5
MPPRPGPAHTPASLSGAYGLAWRLQRGTLLAWMVGFAVAGAVFGGIADGAQDLVGDNDGTRDLIQRMGGHVALTDAFLSTLVDMLGLVCVVFTAGAVLRLRDEETSGRAEPLPASAVGRRAGRAGTWRSRTSARFWYWPRAVSRWVCRTGSPSATYPARCPASCSPCWLRRPPCGR